MAELAGVPVGAVYRFFDDKESIVEMLAIDYWSAFAGRIEELEPEPGDARELCDAVLSTLAEGLRSHAGFLALWFGGLRTERVRDATRPVRARIADAIARRLIARWPGAPEAAVRTAAEMVVLSGDGLLREAFRRDAAGDERILTESGLMLAAYLTARLGEPPR